MNSTARLHPHKNNTKGIYFKLSILLPIIVFIFSSPSLLCYSQVLQDILVWPWEINWREFKWREIYNVRGVLEFEEGGDQ